jgi:hypothetical protein
MAKGRGGQKREVKKPKGGNKPIQTRTTFLPPDPASPKPPAKDGKK